MYKYVNTFIEQNNIWKNQAFYMGVNQKWAYLQAYAKNALRCRLKSLMGYWITGEKMISDFVFDKMSRCIIGGMKPAAAAH